MFAWQTSGERNGVLIQARFFDGDQTDALQDVIRRSLCFLPETRAKLLWSETDHRNVRWGQLVAQSDAVYQLGECLISMEYKTRSKRSLNQASWLSEVSTKDLLQCLIASVAVAQTQGRTCAAVLRFHNVGLLLVPQQRLLDLIVGLIPWACQYFGTPDVSSSDLARYVEPRVLKEFSWRDKQKSRAGEKAHRDMFR